MMRGNSGGSRSSSSTSRFGKRLPAKRSSEVLLLIFAFLLSLVLAASVMGALRNPPVPGGGLLPFPVPEIETAEDKVRLVDAALNAGVFEMPVSSLPALLPLFREYEKYRKLAVPNITMSQYDASCEPYYRDSVAATASFDRDFYSEREHLYKVVYRNRTGALKEEVCDQKAALGCCTACRVEDCCFCKYDGKEDVTELLLANKPLQIKSKITRGFSLLQSEEAKTLSELYGEALASLGYAAARGSREYKSMVWVKNFSYLPPGGFLMWHTNRYDNNVVSYRIYIMSVDKDHGSDFRYLGKDGRTVKVVSDYHGAVRLFKNTKELDAVTGEKEYLWHTVVSESAHRFSLGFEILPDQIIVLMDSCDGCWENLRAMVAAS